jgi:hypothetical protein
MTPGAPNGLHSAPPPRRRAPLLAALAAALLLAAGPSPAAALAAGPVPLDCDGDPPLLINKDSRAHSYTLRCGRKREQRSIAAGARQELKGKGGCRILLGKNKPTTLHSEMACTIKGGVLTCELM